MAASCKWLTAKLLWTVDGLPLKSKMDKFPACNSNTDSLSPSPRSVELYSRSGLGKEEICFPLSTL